MPLLKEVLTIEAIEGMIMGADSFMTRAGILSMPGALCWLKTSQHFQLQGTGH